MIQEFLFHILKMVLKVFTYKHSVPKGQDLENMIQFVKSTPINSLVIDVRDGYGQITMPLDTDNPLVKKHTVNEVPDTTALLKRLEQNKFIQLLVLCVLGTVIYQRRS